MGIPGGPVGQNIATPQVTPAISASSAYADGDCVGGKMEFANAANNGANRGIIMGASIVDLAKQNAEMDLFIFNADFTAAGADNAAFDPADTDLPNCVGVIHFDATDYYDGADSSFAYRECTIPFTLTPPATSLYGRLVTRGTPTYATVADVLVRLNIVQD